MVAVEESYEEMKNGVILFENTSKVNALIKNECCNYYDGNCILLDEGTPHKCSQVMSEKLCCAWFIEAVLPLDKLLENNIFAEKEVEKKKCEACGKSFVPKNNKAKYCEKCAPLVRKRQSAERQRKKRSMSRNRAF